MDFASHRNRLAQQMKPNSLALIPSGQLQYRNNDAAYPFRQNSDFFYLTGFPEPNALAVIASGDEATFTLFCQAPDPVHSVWEGDLIGPEAATAHFGADEAYPITELDKRMVELLAGAQTIYYPFGANSVFDTQVQQWVSALKKQVRSGVTAPCEYVDLATIVHEMRLIKSPAEIDTIKQAVAITTAAHIAAMTSCRPGMNECEIEAELLKVFRAHGSEAPAYTSIVGGGKNACVLHYTKNNAELNDGELLLIDAGAEKTCYAADVTRTFPINGIFTGPQKALYEVVLHAQEAAIEAAKPGNDWDAPHQAAVRALTQGLVDLKLLTGEVDSLIESNAYQTFYMHRTGHWLGLDVHDVGQYKQDGAWRKLEPGMVFTIEPGLYINPKDTSLTDFHNIGIRIEDDILVTYDGCDVLSERVPKTVSDIQDLMKK